MKKNILFVDDEENILKGLRRMLMRKRREWNMIFAAGGEEALTRCRQADIDIIVTDMRMPVMDGLELLTRIMEENPEIIRFVLSGQAEKDVVFGVIKAAHRFLSKPHNSDLMKEKIERVLNARDMISKRRLAGLIAGPDPVRTTYKSLLEMKNELKKDDPDILTIKRIVKSDMVIAAAFMKFASSGFFMERAPEVDPQKIIDTIGIDTIKELVQKYDNFSSFRGESPEDNAADVISDHSVIISRTSRKIAAGVTDDPKLISESGIAGLLHDIGRNIFLSFEENGGSFIDIIKDEFSDEFVDFERNTVCSTHGTAGAVLGTLWGYPESIIRALMYHHNPSDSNSSCFECLTAVHVAESLAGERNGNRENCLDTEYLRNLRLDNKIKEWQKLIIEEVPDEQQGALR